MEKLVIVESPNKVKSIAAYIKALQKEGVLSKEDKYTVESSVGHILELKRSWEPKSLDEVMTFEKKVIKGKATKIKELKKLAKTADLVLLATDPDREGEAIADDLINALEIKEKNKRVTFNEITKDSLGVAFNKTFDLDHDMVKAQKARMVLDRIFGYKLSKWIKQKLWNTSAKSAGRVQSPTLKLVVEREFEIEGFVPEAYWRFEQIINGDLIATMVLDKDKVDGKSNQLDPAKYSEYRDKLKGELTVKQVKVSQKKGAAKTPYKQSAVYRSASSIGLSAASARASMQALFEKGLITYPRTDSTRYSSSFVEKAQKYISDKFGEEYVSSTIKGTKSGAQDAHEALRVTDPAAVPESLAGKLRSNTDLNMYKMIYNNTLQSLMVPPVRESLAYMLDDGGVTFKLSSSKVIYDGYLKVTGWDKGKELPKYDEGDIIKSDEIVEINSETKPRARYNEGSLIEEMEKVGIGRPSTFSSTVGILVARGYVDKQGQALRATKTGKAVALTLMLYFKNIIKEEYTSELEGILDTIAEGKEDHEKVLNGFYTKLNEDLIVSAIKRKESGGEDTQYISLADSEKNEDTPTKVNTKSSEVYSEDYENLVVSFLDYAPIDKKGIHPDYDKFVENEFKKFLGPIVMPQPPKRGRFIFGDEGDLVVFEKDKKYAKAVVCPVCGKHPLIFQGGISKRNQLYWMKACSGWPQTKCKIEEPWINKDEPLFQQLEAYYESKAASYKDEATQEIKNKFKDKDILSTTMQILIKGI